MKPVVSSIDTMFPVTKQPIDKLDSFETTSDKELSANIREQIEYTGTELLLDVKHPKWNFYRATLVDQVMLAYIGRRLIRTQQFTVHWFDSYRIIKHLDGSATVCWTAPTGAESRQWFQIHTNLLHSVGREFIRQGSGAVEYKRGQYQLQPDVVSFKLARDS